MRVAVIPARGGSKRIPRKNIRPFAGRPMISYPIAAAMESGCFDRIVVSTDDSEIAGVARDAGAETPFLRPADLSDDHTPTIPVIRHAIAELGAAETVCCIYATTPNLTPTHLRDGADRLAETSDGFVFPVVRFAHPIQRALRLDPAGRVEMIAPENFARRSQDLEEAWHDAGQFYWARSSTWLTAERIFSPGSIGLPVARTEMIDIDTIEDWQMAERAYGRTD